MSKTSPHCAASEPTAPRVGLLRLADGRHLGVDEQEQIIATARFTRMFEWDEGVPGRVRLRPIGQPGQVTATPGGVVAATAFEPGPAELFEVVRSASGDFTLRLADGVHGWSAPEGDETVVTASEDAPTSFSFVELEIPDAEPGHAHGCSGPRRAAHSHGEAAGVLWNDESHRLIVETAVDRMRAAPNPTPESKRVADLWDNWRPFSHSVLAGLHDADYKDPWRGRIGLIDFYKDHFYDPETRRNYMNEESSAVTEGRRWFNLSVHSGLRMLKLGSRAPASLVQRTAYHLGVSLHFLTDLTQPMHAANFTNVFGRSFPLPSADFRHKGYEDYTEGRVKEGYLANYPHLQPGDLQFDDVENITWFLHWTAVNQKRVFDQHVTGELAKKVTVTRYGVVYHNSWGREAEPSLAAALMPAPRATARYLAYWASRIAATLELDSSRWYTITDHTGKRIGLRDGHFQRTDETGDNTLFYLLFNADGTCTLACKAEKANPWFLYKYWANDNHFVGEFKHASGTPDPWARFRIVPEPGGKVWLFEPSLDEVIMSRDDGYLLRWNPCRRESQLFTFTPVAAISDDDRRIISSIWPHYGQYPWWGDAV